MTWLYFFTYTATLVFVGLCIARFIKIATSPIHFRWELYPVPHESREKSAYGGSRLEEMDWWKKPQKKSFFRELRYMLSEIFFLKSVWENNRGLWIGSFPFHFGLYLLIANVGLLLFSALLVLMGVKIMMREMDFVFYFWKVIYWLLQTTFWVGTIIGLLGSIRLLISRIIDPNLKKYSTASHYFNIILIGVIFFTGFLWIMNDRQMFMSLLMYYYGLITFQPGLVKQYFAVTESGFPVAGYVHIYATLFFMMYLPFTHMTHFFMKYFTYHKVRWEDEPNLPNSKIEGKISKLLNQPVSWPAPHIGADGRKTWIEIAAANPWEKKNEEQLNPD